MIYAMSDLHGQYEKYLAMLEKIGLGEGDTLYLLGDFVDRGEGGVKILLDVMRRKNVKPLIGNHDWTMASLMLNEKALLGKMGKEGLLGLYRLWFSDGGLPTYRALRALDPIKREVVLRFTDNMDFIAEVNAGGKDFILSHTVPRFDPAVPLTDHPASDFIHGEPDYKTRYFPEKTVVTGHTPTHLIDPAYEGRIWQGNGHIALDCGAGFGGPLGCICLDTLEEFYVAG